RSRPRASVPSHHQLLRAQRLSPGDAEDAVAQLEEDLALLGLEIAFRRQQVADAHLLENARRPGREDEDAVGEENRLLDVVGDEDDGVMLAALDDGELGLQK